MGMPSMAPAGTNPARSRGCASPAAQSSGLSGAGVSLPVGPVHQDESVYKNGSEFDGFRFYRMREEEGDSAKTYCVNTNHNFLTFGHGTHAWYSNASAVLNVVLGDSSR